jgi:hypothetical protein
MQSIKDLRLDQEWREEVFKYAEGFSLDDVQEVLFALDGFNDGDEWLGGFSLKDGRYAVVRAEYDYTGWS